MRKIKLSILTLLSFCSSLTCRAEYVDTDKQLRLQQRKAYEAAWTQMDETFKTWSPDRQAALIRKLKVRRMSDVFENKHHYVRAALMQRQLCDILVSAFGTQICDTLFKYPQHFSYKEKSKYTEAVYLANIALRNVYNNNSNIANRFLSILEKKENQIGKIPKQFDAFHAQPLVRAHQYPQRYAYLADKDDSLSVIMKGNITTSQHKYKEAIAFGEQLLAEKKRTIGNRHPGYALTLSDLALTYMLYAISENFNNNMEKATELQLQAINIYHRTKQHEAEKLSLQFLSEHYYQWSRYLDYSDDKKRSIVEQNLKQELAMTRPILGDSTIEVLLAEAHLCKVEGFLDDLAEKRHEMGDKRFGDAIKMFRQGDYNKALEWFDFFASNNGKNDKFIYLTSRKRYVSQWQAACHLHLGDTLKAAELDTYYRLAPVDRCKTVEIDYQVRYGGNYAQAIALARDSMGEGTPEHARLLLHIYQQLANNKQYAAAAQALSKAKTIYKNLLSDEDPAYADMLSELGYIYMGINYYQEAIAAYEESAALTARTMGKRSNQYLTTAIQIAKAAKECNDTRRLAYWIRERLDNDTLTIPVNRLEVMEDFLKAISQSSFPDSTAMLQAMDYGKLCIEERMKMAYAKKPAHPSNDSIANMYDYLLQKGNAFSLMVYMAGICKNMGRTDEMKPIEAQCKAWMRDSITWLPKNEWQPQNDEYTERCYFTLNRLFYCYMHLGILFGNLENYEKALEAFDRARQRLYENQHHIWPIIRGKEHAYDKTNFIIDIYRSLALASLGRHEESIKELRAARTRREEMDGGRKNVYYGVTRRLIGQLFILNRYDEATPELKEWWDFKSNDVLSRLVVLNPQQREVLWNREKNHFEQTLPRFSLKAGTTQLWETLYDNALLTKGLLLNTEMEIERVITQGTDTTQAARYRQLKHNQLLLMGELQKSKQNRNIDTDSLQAHIRTQTYDLMNAMQQNEGNNIASSLRTRWQDVQKRLGKNDVAVEYIVFPLKQDSLIYAALTLRRGYKQPKLTTLCTLNDLKALKASDYYGSSKLFDLLWRPLQDELKNAKNIYFAPIGKLHQIGIEYLPGMEQYNTYRLTSTRELLNAPTKDSRQTMQAALYGGLKFELTKKERTTLTAQLGNNKGQTTFRDVPDLAELRDLRGAAKRMPVLEGTLREVEGIDSLMRSKRIDVSVATGTTGTEESFKALSGQHKGLIHISTHGFYQPEKQQIDTDDDNDIAALQGGRQAQTQEDRSLSRSGLLMTGAADYLFGRITDLDSDDGILTAREISRLDLSGLDLVVLSACETGLGDISGEGVFGLQRGFKKAGAQTLLVSLWKVEDDATQLLMTEFYRGLLSGKSKRQAFLAAQQKLRSAEGGRFNRYECWAAFVMIDALK